VIRVSTEGPRQAAVQSPLGPVPFLHEVSHGAQVFRRLSDAFCLRRGVCSRRSSVRQERWAGPPRPGIDRFAAQIEPEVIACRRQIHEHPELSNREVETGKLVAERLGKLGIAVKTGVAHTGVVGILKGGKPGPVVALRADMDALPVTEEVDVPFASKVRTTYDGKEVGVMHACGHDAHTAILLGVAEVLSRLKAELPGTVEFVFQPAEEGPPAGEEGGARLMIKEGIFHDPKPEAISVCT